MRVRTIDAVVLAAVLLVLAAGCAGSGAATAGRRASSAPGPAGSAAPALDDCFTSARGRIEQVRDRGGGTLTLGIIGRSRRVVVLSDQSDENLCSWLPFASRLAAAGYQVVLWDYGGNLAPEELAGLTGRLRSAGATRILLMGASEGAKASLVAAARIRPAVQGVVSLSAEPVLLPATMVVRSVRHLHCPLLLVTARQDLFGSAQAAPGFLAAARSRDKHLLRVPGTDHGTALLAGRSAGLTVPAVLAFIRRALTGRAPAPAGGSS